MVTVSEFVARLDGVVPFGKAAAWDEVGLQIGDPNAAVGSVGVCHEVNDAVVAEAGRQGIDLLVAYHPLLFQPTTRFVSGSSPSGRAYHLARSDCALVSVHTAFDVWPGGTADSLAQALGLGEARGFGPAESASFVKLVVYVPIDSSDAVRRAMADAGAGTVGQYRDCSFEVVGTGRWMANTSANPSIGAPGEAGSATEVRLEMVAPRKELTAVLAALVAAHPYAEPAYDVTEVEGYQGMIGRVGYIEETTLTEFGGVVESNLGATRIRRTGPADRLIRRVAVLPGAGSSFLAEAAATGADVLVTGDVSHHRAVEAQDRGLAIVDAGHAPTERPGMATLVGVVSELGVPTLDLTEVATDPWDGGPRRPGSLSRRATTEGG